MKPTAVLIAGGGPAGLAAAAELAFHGVFSTIVEPRRTVAFDRPRAKTTSVRTMEHFRRWGVAGQLRSAAALAPAWSERVVFCTSLTGRVITTFGNAFGLGSETLRVSPELGQQVPQPVVEQVLRDHLARSPFVTFEYGSRVTDAREHADGVTVTLADSDGRERELLTRYLLGCDGANSAVRRAIGAAFIGTSDVRPNFNILFRTDALVPVMGDAVHYWVVGGHTPAVIGRLDLDGHWWVIAPGVDEVDGAARADEIIEGLIGCPTACTIVSTDSWTARLLVADRFGSERIFLVGESAHLNPPWGGHGFNTCVGDAVNIAWKLAAVLDGWAPPALLQTYEVERRPIAEQTIETAAQNMRALPVDLSDTINVQTLESAATIIQLAKDAEFHSLGIVLGYTYAGSPIVADGDTKQQPDPSRYRPTSEPGSRLPHGHLSDGRALYDALGPGFTLIAPRGADTQPLLEQAARLGVPLTVVTAPQDYPWGGDVLLVRPDQHIAARSDSVAALDLSIAIGWRTPALPPPITSTS